jgi:hypothetical protein
MQIRVIKTPPAPLMDGFDVRDIHAGYICDVDARTANYLVIAGYAVPAENAFEDDEYSEDVNRMARRIRQNYGRRAEDRIREEHHDAYAKVIPPENDEATH